MILVDLNQISISNLMQEINIKKDENAADTKFLLNMILTSIKMYKTKFSAEFGEIVLCNDSNNYWRKDLFPYYKANKKKAREKSIYDWNIIHNNLNIVKDVLRENFPYKFIEVDRCEADDVIAVLTKNFHAEEPILILSGDRDFVQLFKYDGVQQYSPVEKKFIHELLPHTFLAKKIITGEYGDGIPNILSDSDTFVNPNKKQKRMTEQYIISFNPSNVPTHVYNNWMRNTMLISFNNIPDEYEQAILLEYNKPMLGTHKKAYAYMVENKLKVLLNSFGD